MYYNSARHRGLKKHKIYSLASWGDMYVINWQYRTLYNSVQILVIQKKISQERQVILRWICCNL